MTAQSLRIMQKVEEDGVYIPENMTQHQKTPHVFAMDNLDWQRTTLEGGSFNTTTAIIIESPELTGNKARNVEAVKLHAAPSVKRKTLSDIPDTPNTSLSRFPH